MKRLFCIFFWIALWAVLALVIANPLIFPGPVETAIALGKLLVNSSFWVASAITALEILFAFLLAFVLGIGFGLLGGTTPAFAAIMEPFVAACKSIPIACITVILMLFAGPFFLVIAVVFLLVFPAYYSASKTAYLEFGSSKLAVLSRYGLNAKQILGAYVGPHLLGYVRATSQAVVGMSWKAAIAAQVIGLLGIGLGDMVYRSKVILDISELFALTILIVCFSFLAEKATLAALAGFDKLTKHIALSAKRNSYTPKPAKLVLGQRTIQPLDTLLLVGKTGSGKTTELNKLFLSAKSHPAYLLQSSLIPKNLSSLEALSLLVSKKAAEQMLYDVFGEYIPPQPIKQLSGGQVRLVELLIALASHSSALLLDEPFQGMDKETKALAIQAILRYANRRPLLISAHSAEDAKALHADVVTIDNKELTC